MKKFGIVTNEMKDPGLDVTERISRYLMEKGASSIIEKTAQGIQEEVDCLLVLGGDGTMLQAAREVANKKVPMIGVNLGTLGYLAEIEMKHLEEALDQLLEGEYELEERMMLAGRIEKKDHEIYMAPALNDIAITRCGSLQIIRLNISVNGKFLCHWHADGVIISTATGSTGYNMSAGGPLVEPGAGLMVLTPICAHTLNARSIILREEDVIEIEIASGRGGSKLVVEANSDGSERTTMETGDKIYINKATSTTTIVKLSKVSFLEMLHKKMADC